MEERGEAVNHLRLPGCGSWRSRVLWTDSGQGDGPAGDGPSGGGSSNDSSTNDTNSTNNNDPHGMGGFGEGAIGGPNPGGGPGHTGGSAGSVGGPGGGQGTGATGDPSDGLNALLGIEDLETGAKAMGKFANTIIDAIPGGLLARGLVELGRALGLSEEPAGDSPPGMGAPEADTGQPFGSPYGPPASATVTLGATQTFDFLPQGAPVTAFGPYAASSEQLAAYRPVAESQESISGAGAAGEGPDWVPIALAAAALFAIAEGQ